VRRYALLVLLGTLIAPGISAQRTPPQAESQARLKQIRQERAKLRAELQKLQSREQNVSGQIRNIERQVSTSATLLRELERRLQNTEQDITRTTRELNTTQQEFAERRAALHQRMSEIYKRGPLQTPEVLLSANNFGDLLNRYKYLSLVAESDRALVRRVAELRDQLQARERKLRRSFLEVQTLRGERMEEYGELRGLEAQRRDALALVQEQQRAANVRLARLARDEKRITDLIALLERRRREAERRAAAAAAARARAPARPGAPRPAARPAAPAAAITTRDIGNLGWPVDGRVLYRFGRSVQPNGTVIRRNGIGIGAAPGTAVRSVEAGTVVLAEAFEGYGPSVILSHGGGYYSLYLYLDQVNVREGAQVTRGQTLGTVGGQGTPEGPHLEFQIRTPDGPATDPLGWLRKRAS
jgi:septal ring factor EnvC (AmiA/AmiB activator)